MILALDPSLCCTGWILAASPTSPVSELLTGTITTEPSAKSRRLYQAEDDAQRGRKIAQALRDLKMGDPSTQVACEQPGGSQSARGAAALKLVQGVILGVMGPLEVRWVLPSEAKVALTKSKNASKDQMVKAAEKRGLKLIGNKLDREAIADALGVLIASQLWRAP